jgi:putative nucleotidyltransferase with HDIG domain
MDGEEMTQMVAVDYRAEMAKKITELPPFSPVLNKLVATLANDNISFMEVGKLIEQDTVLAGNVLRMVNSAAYNLRSTVTSISYAVSILGVDKLRNMALAIAVSRMWNSLKPAAGWSPARFNQHSLATALLADSMALNLRVDYPEGAFLAGLMHDLGKLVVATGFTAEYGEIQGIFESGAGAWEECERKVLGMDHAAVSAQALEQWKMPEPISRAVRMHHMPELVTADGIPLSRVVHVASGVADRLGYGAREKAEAAPGEETAAAWIDEACGVNKGQKILDSFGPEFEAIRAAS